MLIPAYKDMDPYELPEEFSHLQAQDMSKLGFMQDLIRGIKKIVKDDEPKTTVVKETIVKETVATAGAASTEALLKRAFLFLEDGDWESADEYCEKALDADSENARAYIVKLMIEFEVQLQEDLRYTDIELDNVNYKKALRFADADLKEMLAGYVLEERYESCEYYIEKAEELESDDPDQAISYYKKALTNFEEIFRSQECRLKR
jgi:tetratricopeptide (TPR) repeat protein